MKYATLIIGLIVSAICFGQGSSSSKITAGNVGSYAWKLTGNSGTTAGTNFIGTTDGASFIIQPGSGNVGIGTTTPFGKFTVVNAAQSVVFGSQYSLNLSDTVWGTTMVDSCHQYGYIIQNPNAPNDHYQIMYSNDTCNGEGVQLMVNHDAFNQEMAVIMNYDNPDTNKSSRLTFNSDGLRVLKNTDFSYLFQITPTGQMVYPKDAGAGKVLGSDANGLASWDTTSFTPLDSVSIYAITPTNGTTYFCTDCTGSGVTGRIVSYFGAAWRRLRFD